MGALHEIKPPPKPQKTLVGLAQLTFIVVFMSALVAAAAGIAYNVFRLLTNGCS